MKFIIVATVGNFYINCSFLKPLNPILGETIQAQYVDGTLLYAEQISHHPPVSYFLVYGPDQSYKFYGYYNYDAKAGLNSLTLKNRGKRVIAFKDGSSVEYNFGHEEYCGSFWGPMKVEVKGKLILNDKVNNVTAEMEFDNVRWKASDYFQGDIRKNGHRVSKIYGSYMGFINFDDKRYWDYSVVQPYQFTVLKSELESDHSRRSGNNDKPNEDRNHLLKGRVDEAQADKDSLEARQRTDIQLRKNTKQH